MENGCPVLPKRIKISEQTTQVEALTLRAKKVEEALALSDEEAALSFIHNFEHLKMLGDPMMEWFVLSREMGLSDKDKAPQTQDNDGYYSF